MPRNLLLTGFGPFLNVSENPSGRLAEALHGTLLATAKGPIQLCSKVLAVKYETVASETLLAARQIDAIGILGMGVARGASAPRVERTGHARCDGITPDAAGQTRETLGEIPVLVTPWAEPLARALGVDVSDDAGGYVCNAWLYGVLAALAEPVLPSASRPRLLTPVAFLHLPDSGLAADVLAAALAKWIDEF